MVFRAHSCFLSLLSRSHCSTPSETSSLSLRTYYFSLILYCTLSHVIPNRTGFLVGPVRQIKSMFDPTRLITTIVFLSAMALTIVAALVVRSAARPSVAVSPSLMLLLFSVGKCWSLHPVCDYPVVGLDLVLIELHPICSYSRHQLCQGTRVNRAVPSFCTAVLCSGGHLPLQISESLYKPAFSGTVSVRRASATAGQTTTPPAVPRAACRSL